MKKWHIVIDVEKCEGCNNCFLACKDEHVDNDFPDYALAQPDHGQRWMNIMMSIRGQYPLIDVAYLPVPCMHCDNAPCIKAAKGGAVYKRKDGIVIIDPEKAKGQRNIIDACPYGAIWWNEEKNIPQKCTLCAHLLDDGWKEPRCVKVCPTGALSIRYVDESEMQKIVDSEKLEFYQPQYKTNPRVHYKNLYRYTRCFISGSVSVKKDEKYECAEGAEIALVGQSGNKIATGVTDNFGDFKFDNLEENSGKYKIEIAYHGYDKKIIEVDMKTSCSIGDILLS